MSAFLYLSVLIKLINKIFKDVSNGALIIKSLSSAFATVGIVFL